MVFERPDFKAKSAPCKNGIFRMELSDHTLTTGVGSHNVTHNMSCKFKGSAACRLIVFTILVLAALPASALVFIVSNTKDTYSFTSLRGAIMVAN